MESTYQTAPGTIKDMVNLAPWVSKDSTWNKWRKVIASYFQVERYDQIPAFYYMYENRRHIYDVKWYSNKRKEQTVVKVPRIISKRLLYLSTVTVTRGENEHAYSVMMKQDQGR